MQAIFCSAVLAGALAISGCQALRHVPTPPHDMQADLPTPLPAVRLRVLWGEPGALPPVAMDPRRSLGLGIEPVIRLKF